MLTKMKWNDLPMSIRVMTILAYAVGIPFTLWLLLC